MFIFDLLGHFFYQGYLQFFLIIGVFYLVYKITIKIGYLDLDSKYLAFAFCFSSVFLGVAFWPWSWYFAHVIVVFLIFLSIYEYLGKKRDLIIGIIFALILATRFSAVLGISFFILDIFASKKNSLNKLSRILKVTTPIIIVVLLLSTYNLARFGSLTKTGYLVNNIPENQEKAREYGSFSLYHIPGNIYYMLFAVPLPVFRDNVTHVLKFPFIKANEWGMSIFITSPYFVYLFFLKIKDRLSKWLIITTLIVIVPIFAYFSLGWWQYGYRYSLDFLPFLFFLLITNYRRKYKRLTNSFKLTVLFSSIVNLYLFLTLLYYL